ncbi:hypothetical protein BV25DRAFT_1912281 [Artomyces pyxidatus]|uniref:Uncharacterized protein n=1 Tax=Artomyces pyxidatus TaxID=48021 RepID=A0ACB8TEU9_9AGAM|nr:hypothetical protein BV25DRAFT_1912281 [Artomyces pyxidatus]
MPGKHVANDSLFIDVAITLWACEFEPAKDELGDPIPIDVDGWLDQGTTIRPVHFTCDVT